jgi:hypothetical protein
MRSISGGSTECGRRAKKSRPEGRRLRTSGRATPGEVNKQYHKEVRVSKANQQSLVMLSSFAGCMGNLLARNSFARLDIKRQIAQTFDWTCHVIKYWPGDNSEDVADAKAKIDAWAVVMGDRQDRLSARTIIYIAGRVLLDLDSRLKNREKRAAIGQLQRLFKPIEDFVDPDKGDFLSFEEGDKMLDMLQNIIEWEEA